MLTDKFNKLSSKTQRKKILLDSTSSFDKGLFKMLLKRQSQLIIEISAQENKKDEDVSSLVEESDTTSKKTEESVASVEDVSETQSQQQDHELNESKLQTIGNQKKVTDKT